VASPPEVRAEWQSAPQEVAAQRAFRVMLLMRRFEEKVGQLYALGRIPALPKLSIGREGLSYGLLQAATPDQTIIAGRRCHALLLGAGINAEALMAALTTHADGVGELIADNSTAFDHQLIVTQSSTEAQLKDAIALAKTANTAPSPQTIFAIIDGADIQHDIFAELVQDASAQQLPLVILFDMALLASSDSSPTAKLIAQGLVPNLVYKTINGIDHHTVEQACTEAATVIATGAGPVVLDIATQSFRGHGTKRRAQTTRLDRNLLDPILMVRSRLIENGTSDEEALEQVEGWVRLCVNDAAETAARPTQTASTRT
jgi:pyruvate dehydrogenase E1 component subunit alpha